MESTFTDVCSICFEIFHSSEKIFVHGDLLKLLKYLYERINEVAVQNSHICRTCLEKIEDAYNFKISYVKKFIKTAETKEKNYSKFCACRICNKVVRISPSTSLINFTKNYKYVIDYLPEGLGLEGLEDQHICSSCQKSVLNLCSIINLLSLYEKNEKYQHNTMVELVKENHMENNEDINNNDFVKNVNQLEVKKEIFTEYSNRTCRNLDVNLIQLQDVNNPIKEENNECGGKIKTETNEENQIKEELSTECENSTTDTQMQNGNIKGLEDKSIESRKYNNNNIQVESIHKNFSSEENRLKIKEEAITNSDKTCENSVNIQLQNVDIKTIKDEISIEIEEQLQENEELDFKLGCDSIEEMCWEQIDSKSSLPGVFMENNSTNKIFVCELCDFKTDKKNYFENHMIYHKNMDMINTLKCDICDYQSKNKQHLKWHMLNHTNKKCQIFKCKYCEYKTITMKYLTKHHKSVHSLIRYNNMFTCDICRYRSLTKGCLKRHMLSHKNIDEVETYKCNNCEYKAKVKNNLTRHMLVHQNINELEVLTCDTCGYKSAHKANLQRHMLIHTSTNEVLMFKCGSCEYQTKRKHDLKVHITSIHKKIDEVEHFKCDICGYKAKLITQRNLHMFVHKNVDESEMLKCDICNYKTNQKRYLTRHKLHHKKALIKENAFKIFPCSICGFKLNKQKDLKDHLAMVHGKTEMFVSGLRIQNQRQI